MLRWRHTPEALWQAFAHPPGDLGRGTRNVLKKEATLPSGLNSLQQHERFHAFVREFDAERPHEALDMKYSAELYTASARASSREAGARHALALMGRRRSGQLQGAGAPSPWLHYRLSPLFLPNVHSIPPSSRCRPLMCRPMCLSRRGSLGTS